ncbi:hypothetical protein J2T20_003336 [Paenibacillus wynnii]|nr:hypothetical protein [Paenibacillus wynnii]
MRDYDELVKEEPRVTEPRIFGKGKRIVFQVWDWEELSHILKTVGSRIL